MKSESDTNAADEDETKWSFLRRLIVAMAAERLKKADEVVKPRPPRASGRFSLKPPFAHAASVAARGKGAAHPGKLNRRSTGEISAAISIRHISVLTCRSAARPRQWGL